MSTQGVTCRHGSVQNCAHCLRLTLQSIQELLKEPDALTLAPPEILNALNRQVRFAVRDLDEFESETERSPKKAKISSIPRRDVPSRAEEPRTSSNKFQPETVFGSAFGGRPSIGHEARHSISSPRRTLSPLKSPGRILPPIRTSSDESLRNELNISRMLESLASKSSRGSPRRTLSPGKPGGRQILPPIRKSVVSDESDDTDESDVPPPTLPGSIGRTVESFHAAPPKVPPPLRVPVAPPMNITRTLNSRSRWTVEQVKDLREGHERLGSQWEKIRSSFPSLRGFSGMQLKDKYRAILH